MTYASLFGSVGGIVLYGLCQWVVVFWTYGAFVSPLMDKDAYEIMTSRGAMVCVPVAMVCFSIGTRNYLRLSVP